MAGENKLQEVIETSMESLRSLVDSDTIIGNPINTPSGTTVIPVSKVTIGLATGGLDYASKSAPIKQNFGGGGGTGLSVSPVGFLVIKADGSVEMLNTGNTNKNADQLATLIERAPELFAKIKAFFNKKNKDAEAEETEAPAEEKAAEAKQDEKSAPAEEKKEKAADKKAGDKAEEAKTVIDVTIE